VAKRLMAKRSMAMRRKAKRKSVVQIWSGRLPPMQRPDFHIGCEFLTASGRWRCTDIGKRTIAAIRLDHDDDPSWYNGPPYAAMEIVFDEYDFEGCEPAPERRTYDASASEVAVPRRRKRRRVAKSAPKHRPKRNSRGKRA
jgi:hypothetical protein